MPRAMTASNRRAEAQLPRATLGVCSQTAKRSVKKSSSAAAAVGATMMAAASSTSEKHATVPRTLTKKQLQALFEEDVEEAEKAVTDEEAMQIVENSDESGKITQKLILTSFIHNCNSFAILTSFFPPLSTFY